MKETIGKRLLQALGRGRRNRPIILGVSAALVAAALLAVTPYKPQVVFYAVAVLAALPLVFLAGLAFLTLYALGQLVMGRKHRPHKYTQRPELLTGVRVVKDGGLTTVILARPAKRNAIDPDGAEALWHAFREFEDDPKAAVAVLWGEGGHFCAGADLEKLDEFLLDPREGCEPNSQGPLGPTRLELSKPVIAAVAGHAVAGGLELALWCDLRVVEEDAVFGVFCRRFGVPLIDGGTVRLPRLIGESRALDLVLTGRPVAADEALSIGLANRVVPKGESRAAAETLARELIALPQTCLRNDRRTCRDALGLTARKAMAQETRLGFATLHSGEAKAGAQRFREGAGRHGGPAAPAT